MECCPVLTVDVVVFHEGKVLLVKRGAEPFKGKWALPGGRVECGERVEEAALRELKEETGIEAELVTLVSVYSDPNRDPRGHYVSVAFLAAPKGNLEPKASTDAAEAKWFELSEVPWEDLAFDHAEILKDALKMLLHLGKSP
ncbi:NUDIX domain-containing protein [Ignicoccus hospitalis]|uniref:NUDIX hydrolase n=1 Tax=Ignicoccus hospitalis (strain KIN4/I / DSM 18386 / JCM 14125) TaxID=453591 RepID=A8AAZ3_IGNH4|nr:NUDIX hydrolase [Ignicoccus hospitalis]ABU82095.1 NUDIX hydrolase [Ignicoccus hospitalis KIN4/I]